MNLPTSVDPTSRSARSVSALREGFSKVCLIEERIFPGVQNRECNMTSSGEDGCDILCCNHGYQRSATFVKTNCQCRFIWCCDVVCRTCTEKKEIYTCRWFAAPDTSAKSNSRWCFCYVDACFSLNSFPVNFTRFGTLLMLNDQNSSCQFHLMST